jgi:hypothetical protein
MISGELDTLTAELSLHAAQKYEDVLLSLLAAQPTAGVSYVRSERNVHARTIFRPPLAQQGTNVPK